MSRAAALATMSGVCAVLVARGYEAEVERRRSGMHRLWCEGASACLVRDGAVVVSSVEDGLYASVEVLPEVVCAPTAERAGIAAIALRAMLAIGERRAQRARATAVLAAKEVSRAA